MIGRCECCERQNVPISHFDTIDGVRAFACDQCLGEDDPDLSGELDPIDQPTPRKDKDGMFRDHSCWKCKDGEQPCVQKSPNQCGYPHARND